ncbi:hypothetical protein K490DRAFT_49907 [Saccharata proteae CBS 121410]|uniref:Peroxisomal membrane protein Pex17 n=1 Tax=Saccharata proteae CBS 121410 TaxID=1314787 RepID=A0A9P4HNL6_9PEZI|nr:hypothetical protein K490DRAFT_49907 [Saccharata proteae CBS 121410]
MPADRLLQTLLRSLQTYTEHQDTPRLLSTASSLLTTLTNPLNITLLTAQLLTAPALWTRPDGLKTCLSVMSVFHAAGRAVLAHERDVRDGQMPPRSQAGPGQVPIGGNMAPEQWARAVVAGADERSARWRHLLVLGGLLMCGERDGGEGGLAWPKGLERALEKGLAQAVNLVTEEVGRGEGEELAGLAVAMVLGYAWGRLGEPIRREVEYDALLPVLFQAAFASSEGFQSAYFLGAVDLDVVQVKGGKFDWSPKSNSFRQLQNIASRPLLSSMGSLSRLIAYSIEHVRDPWIIQTTIDHLADFARALTLQWRQMKLSQIDASEESVFLLRDTTQTSLPLLWRVLKAALFATVIILRGALGRTLADGFLAADGVAPVIVSQTLHTLRNLYFISSRLGADSFSQYTFVYLTAIDILTQYPIQADSFLKAIQPTNIGHIPPHPLDRTLDLFFLNTAEHFTLLLPPTTNESLLLAAATPYLATDVSHHLLPIFEAAHSVTLAVLAAPHSANVAAKHLPFYVNALFQVFPANLSPRQFRLAFKTLLKVTAPPSPLSATHQDLPATLLELVRHRAINAPTTPLPTAIVSPTSSTSHHQHQEQIPPNTPALSEQGVLVLTLLDALPFLPVPLLEEWLPLAAELVNGVRPEELSRVCRERFWEVLVGGEMDAERSLVAVGWWGTRGGREMVMGGGDDEEYMMSGALGGRVGERESKL